MKELSIEEKAKRYDEAIRESSKIINHCAGGVNIPECISVKATIEQIFPELNESEDEKIRKVLVEFFKSYKEQGTIGAETFNGIPTDDIVTWLEKQGEQNLTLPKWKYKNDNAPLLRDSLILNKYGCVAKSPSGAIVSGVWVIDYDELAKLPKEEIEKQSKQETLCDKCRKEQPSHSCQDITALGRCALEKQGEQKSADIRTTGYWNVQEVEQKPAWSKEDEQILNAAILHIKNETYNYYGGYSSEYIMQWLKSLKDRVQPKQEWSEEDEKIYKSITYSFAHNYPLTVQQQEFVKSLKLQKQWKPSDEQIEILDMVLSNESMDDNIARILRELREQLKKLREE